MWNRVSERRLGSRSESGRTEVTQSRNGEQERIEESGSCGAGSGERRLKWPVRIRRKVARDIRRTGKIKAHPVLTFSRLNWHK